MPSTKALIPIQLSVRYHLRPLAADLFRRTRGYGLAPLVPLGALVIFGYARYLTSVPHLLQFLSRLELRLISTSLLLLAAFSVAPLKRLNLSFFRLAPADPHLAFRVLLSNGFVPGTAYSLVYLAGVLPFVIRSSAAGGEAILHAAGIGSSIPLFYLAATVPARTASLALGLGALIGAELLLLYVWPLADLILVPIKIALGAAYWTYGIDRVPGRRLQAYLNNAMTARPRRAASRGRFRPLRAETKVYLTSFLLTRESLFPLLVTAGILGYLTWSVVRGIPGDRQQYTVTILTCAAVFTASGIFIESISHLNLLAPRLAFAGFSRLTMSLLLPHWIMVGAVTTPIALVRSVAALDLAALFVVISQLFFLPILAWTIAVVFLHRRLLASFCYGAIGLAGAVSAVLLPGAYAVFMTVSAGLLFRSASRHYRLTTASGGR